jgi:oxalate decarboxylase/phosphoglucose isomerase-like protein (cupin superfamily)
MKGARNGSATAGNYAGALHAIENTGDTDLVFLEMFAKVPRFEDLSFSEWLAHTPAEAVIAHTRFRQGHL